MLKLLGPSYARGWYATLTSTDGLHEALLLHHFQHLVPAQVVDRRVHHVRAEGYGRHHHLPPRQHLGRHRPEREDAEIAPASACAPLVSEGLAFTTAATFRVDRLPWGESSSAHPNPWNRPSTSFATLAVAHLVSYDGQKEDQ